MENARLRGIKVGSLLGLSLLGLSACNDHGPQPLSLQPVDQNSVNGPISTSPTATPAPTPTPTSTTTPAPTPTPIPTSTGNVTDLYTGPAEMAKYVQKFIDDGKAQGRDVIPDMTSPKLEIQLGSLSSYGSSVIGLCETGGNMRRVTFSPSYWNSANDTAREIIAHHELGHCILNRPHRSDLLDSGAYASMMYPIMLSNSTYTSNMTYYLQELFGANLLSAPAEDGSDERKIHICDLDDVPSIAR